MPSTIPADLFDRVQAQLPHFPRGASVDQLMGALLQAATRRTLQRKLAEWVEAGKIRATGVLKGRRYFALSSFEYAPLGQTASYSVREPLQDGYVPISTQGAEVRRIVQRREYDPDPIAYRREFLDEYRPNVSMYLPEHVRGRLKASGAVAGPERPPGTFARQILQKLLIDLAWSSSRLEGNSYSFFDTKRLIETGESAPGRTELETQMVLNHKAAIEMLLESADQIAVNRYTVLSLHALLAADLLSDERAIGTLRRAPVSISGSGYRPPVIPQLIDECFQMILDKCSAIEDPFEQSFFLMVHLPYLQPFMDVNKRTSRLAANIPLIKHNLAPLSFIDVPERAYFDGTLAVYELNRIELLRDVYVWAYETSSKRYVTEYDRIPPIDPLKTKYRAQMTAVIRDIVLKGFPIEDGAVRSLAAPNVDSVDLDAFVDLVLRSLRALHEYNSILFQLPRAEFKDWERVHGFKDS